MAKNIEMQYYTGTGYEICYPLVNLSNITGTLAIANGGTGATDASTARTNLGITPANIGAASSSELSSLSNTVSGINTNVSSLSSSVSSLGTRVGNLESTSGGLFTTQLVWSVAYGSATTASKLTIEDNCVGFILHGTKGTSVQYSDSSSSYYSQQIGISYYYDYGYTYLLSATGLTSKPIYEVFWIVDRVGQANTYEYVSGGSGYIYYVTSVSSMRDGNNNYRRVAMGSDIYVINGKSSNALRLDASNAGSGGTAYFYKIFLNI